MEQENKKQLPLRLIISGAALLIAAIMLILYFTVIVPKPAAGEKRIAVEIAYLDKTYTYEDLFTEKLTVFELLEEYNEELELSLQYNTSEYGVYLTGMKGTAVNEGQKYYYMYSVNGVYSNFGVSAQTIRDGDRIRFEYGEAEYDPDWNQLGTKLAPGGDGSMRKRPVDSNLIIIIAVSSILVVFAAVYVTVTLVKAKAKKGQ